MEYVTSEEMFELVHGRRTDEPEWFEFNGVTLDPVEVATVLRDRLSVDRRQTIEQVLRERTNSLTVVVEGMVDLGNVSAVMRSADGFGVQSFHAIDTADVYKRSRRTTRGTDKWLDRYRWDDADACLVRLRDENYEIVVTDPNDGEPLYDTDLTGRLAIVFGNELEGVSSVVRSSSDRSITIPMRGFGESFNISVAASIVLSEATRQRKDRYGASGDLDNDAIGRIRAVWYMKSVREARMIVQRAIDDGQVRPNR
ncbi:MAG: TrmH family RNA methyltransferase [Proteobacteria bacterium]|nr:TrmH family RNA methyltransferase [Pseudomonadota bacterium]